jgi:hypothetical protein
MIIDGENGGLNECNMKVIFPKEINEMERNIQGKYGEVVIRNQFVGIFIM